MKKKTLTICVTPEGECRAIITDGADRAKGVLRRIGSYRPVRASHVEPDDVGDWVADLSPVNGPKLGPFTLRADALAAETAWLEENWLPGNSTDAPSEPFRLVSEPLSVRWSMMSVLTSYLTRPWTQTDAGRLEEIISRWEDRLAEGHGCDRDVMGRLLEMACCWQRIASAPPIPSTARLRRELVLPPRDDREIALYRKIATALDARHGEVFVGVKVFKTSEPARRQKLRILGGDEKYQRLLKAKKMLGRYAPHAAYNSQNRDQRAAYRRYR